MTTASPFRHKGPIAALAVGWFLLAHAVMGAGQLDDRGKGDPYAGKSCLTSGCHAKLLEPKFVHAPIGKNKCTPCHEPTDQAKHKFHTLETGTCINCHPKWFEQMHHHRYLHPPAEAGDCLGCHVPHASSYNHLLVSAFAKDLYVSVNHSEKYGLCFECHDSELYEEQETDEDTEFRNGEINLHYLHVNKESKGRSCRICHRPHASDQPHMIRSVVPYGQWKIKIHYVATETGGACAAACHPAKQYDRETPVDWTKEPVLKEWSHPKP